MPEIRTIKLVVGVMTGAILLMSGLVVYGIIRNAGAASTPLMENDAVWRESLPAGTEPKAISTSGQTLAVLADSPEGPQVLVFDLRTGKMRGILSETR